MKRAPLVLACLLTQPSGAYGPPVCQAKLVLEQQAQFLTVTGHCRSLLATPARYRYQLLVLHQGAGGRSQNAQGGAFALPAQQEAVLSRVRLQTSPDDHYSVRLLIFDEAGHPVAQDSTGR